MDLYDGNKNTKFCSNIYKIDDEKNSILDNKIKKLRLEDKLINIISDKDNSHDSSQVDFRKNDLYSDLIKNTDFYDIFSFFNEILHGSITQISSKIENFSTLFLKMNRSKEYKYLRNIRFFGEFTSDVILSNIYSIFRYSLLRGKDSSSNFFDYQSKKNINKDELIDKMDFFPKYNNKNSDIANFIKDLNDIDYMIISLFFYIKSNLILSIKKINIDNPSDKEEILNYLHELVERLHDMYLYTNCICDEIIKLHIFVKNKFEEIDKKVKKNKKPIKVKKIYMNKVKTFIESTLNEIDFYFKRRFKNLLYNVNII